MGSRLTLDSCFVIQNFGFDISWWSSCLGVTQFKDRYGVSPGPGEAKVIPSTWQSVGSGTPNAGMAIGCLLGGYANQWLGRKRCIALLSVIAIIGIILQVSIDSYWGIIAGRTINGLSVGKFGPIL
jgi:MFS transporter, SP family, sugar:H+ symporter